MALKLRSEILIDSFDTKDRVYIFCYEASGFCPTIMGKIDQLEELRDAITEEINHLKLQHYDNNFSF